MIKKQLYPKTTRISNGNNDIVVTEKLDGSNLGFFKKNNILHIAQRNNIFKVDELTKENAYKGLIGWLEQHKEVLYEELNEGSVIIGEWIGMGKIKYGESLSDKFYMFAKANVNDKFDLYNIYYDRSLFIYPFKNMTFPDFISVVPKVAIFDMKPTVKELDDLYDEYCKKVERPVEGFVISLSSNTVQKYVRLKNGKLTEHKEAS